MGDSDQLRNRKLQPVRGVASEAVAESQRERLYGAIVACVSQHGLAGTTLAELVDVSGVSSRSFYKFFPDKSACLTAAVTTIAADARLVMHRERPEDDLETQLRGDFRTFAEAAIQQPAAAKVCLVDSFAAGPDALRPVQEGIEDYEGLLLKRLRATQGRGETSRQEVTARVGGVVEVFRSRLRRGRQEELRTLEDEMVELFLADRPPPQPLRFAARLPKASPESITAPDHAERAIRAFAVLVAEKGYVETSVDDVIKKASMSASTFYANFSGKEDLMGAAIDYACAQAVAAVMPAFAQHEDWIYAVRAGLGALLNFLASRPALARLVTAEVDVAGAWAIERRIKGLSPLGSLVENNTTEWMSMPPSVYEMIAGGVRTLIDQTARREGVESLPALAPICTYISLSPFIGSEEACAVANDDGSRRSSRSRAPNDAMAVTTTGALPLHAPVKRALWMALNVLYEKEATPSEVAETIDEDPAGVAEHLAHMAQIGAVEVAGERNGEPLYRSFTWRDLEPYHRLSVLTNQQSAMLTPEERTDIYRQVWGVMDRSVRRSIEDTASQSRSDWHFTRTPMRVDQQGWRELLDLHTTMLTVSFEIQSRNRQRLDKSKEEGFEAESIQVVFESPEDAWTEKDE